MKVMQVPSVDIIKLPPVLTIYKISEIFGITRGTIMRAVSERKLIAHRPNAHSYTFVTEEVMDWIRAS